VRSDRAKSLEKVFALEPLLAARRRNWQPMMEEVTTAPLIYRTPSPVQANLIFVGDAAAFIDPFVGDGISIALRTGCLGANELRGVFDGSSSVASATASYAKNYLERFEPLIRSAARIRSLLDLPRPMQFAALEVFRLPGILPYVIRKTRRSR
jgi:flavin-dependent dehydrogenase